MKAIFIAYLLLASMLFLHIFIFNIGLTMKAATYTVVTAPTKNPNNPIVNCPPNRGYRECRLKPRLPPAPKCSGYSRRCPP
ncbi:hypothetical protein AHAS_Ahas14G0249600 [Arachis hypogaea]